MTYDLGDKLTGINPTGSADDATFTFDALGRFRTRVLAASTDTYSYAGTSEVVQRIANSGGTTTDSIVSPAGDRLGVQEGGTLNWFVPDLHGNVAASLSASEAMVTNATRYDAYGQTIATGTAGGTAVGQANWKYQGRLDVSGDADSPLYDMSARFYSPGLGTFTQLDSVMGSAQNPVSMNRFLYAHANPATLVDPTGHYAIGQICPYGPDDCSAISYTPQSYSTSSGGGSGGGSGGTSIMVLPKPKLDYATPDIKHRDTWWTCYQYGSQSCLSRAEFDLQVAWFGKNCRTHPDSMECILQGGPDYLCTSVQCQLERQQELEAQGVVFGDLLSTLEPTGALSGAFAAKDCSEGNYVSCAANGAGAIPVGGKLIKGAKWIVNALEAAIRVAKQGGHVADGAKLLDDLLIAGPNAPRSPDDLALGLTGVGDKELLGPFAKGLGVKTHADFDLPRPTQLEWSHLQEIIDRTVSGGNRLHFNLEE